MHEWVMGAVPVLIAAACLGALGAGVCLLVGAVRFRRAAHRAAGEVVRAHAQWQDVTRFEEGGAETRRALVHYPVIAFEDAEGVRHEVRANIGGCTPGYRVGDRVPVLFAPGDPQSMRVDSFLSLYFNAACMLCMAGVSALILALWLLYT
jgi:Protein of unknown function (DUF3592)